jgi:hypothetical protein
VRTAGRCARAHSGLCRGCFHGREGRVRRDGGEVLAVERELGAALGPAVDEPARVLALDGGLLRTARERGVHGNAQLNALVAEQVGLGVEQVGVEAAVLRARRRVRVRRVTQADGARTFLIVLRAVVERRTRIHFLSASEKKVLGWMLGSQLRRVFFLENGTLLPNWIILPW